MAHENMLECEGWPIPTNSLRQTTLPQGGLEMPCPVDRTSRADTQSKNAALAALPEDYRIKVGGRVTVRMPGDTPVARVMAIPGWPSRRR